MAQKYEFTDEIKEFYSGTLHRIRAVRDIIDKDGKILVKKGDLGGWIESENNLSHKGTCWVYDEATVFGNGLVCENGTVRDCGSVFGNGLVCGNSNVFKSGAVCCNGKVLGNGRVCDYGIVAGSSLVYGVVAKNGNARGNSVIYDNAIVYGTVEDNAIVSFCSVSERAHIAKNAKILFPTDVFTAEPIGERMGCITFYRTVNDNISVAYGYYFNLTLEELKEYIYKECDSFYSKQYEMVIELAKMSILRNV